MAGKNNPGQASDVPNGDIIRSSGEGHLDTPDQQISVSVIVPIRNGARFLDDCVGFLSAQTYEDFEIVFVVDAGSTDDTVKKVESIVDSRKGARLILQDKSLKLGGNRNLGLTDSKGRYVWFLDVDDAPSKDFLKDMVRLIKETGSDLVCCNFINTDANGTVKEKPGKECHRLVLNREEAIDARNRDLFPVSTWSKLFRRDFLIDNGLLFEDTMSEDVIHTYRCVEKCNKICIYDRPLYAYRQHKESLCSQDPDARGRAEIEAYCEVDRLFSNDPEVLRRNAVMKIRSSGHMSHKCFRQYAKSPENRESYNKYLKDTFEGWWHIHLPTLYWIAIRTYVATVYKRKGSNGMYKKF